MGMSSKKHQIPAIRFKGFTDAWEQRKLKEVANHRGGTAIEKYFSKNGKYKVISIGSYGINSKYIDQGIRAVSNDITDVRVVRKGELTMVLNDKTSNGTIIGRSLLIDTDNEYVINQRTEILSPKENFDSSFAYITLNGPFREKVRKIVQGGTQIYVNYPVVENLKLELPDLEEQKKIGTFFKYLDDTIDLHQRQMDNCKELKKTSMQKIFNQELRFKDKNGNDYPVWQKKKLKDLGKFYSGTGFNDKYQGYLDLSIPFFKVSDMNIASNSKYMVESNNTVDDDICREMKINKITGPAILFAKVGAAIYMERKRIVHNDFLMDNNMMALRINDSVDIEFTYYLCQSLSFSKYAQVGALPSYNASDIGRLHCKLPVISEQKKIAIFLSILDQKVNEAAQKVELFKELKEGLMQQMFF